MVCLCEVQDFQFISFVWLFFSLSFFRQRLLRQGCEILQKMGAPGLLRKKPFSHVREMQVSLQNVFSR